MQKKREKAEDFIGWKSDDGMLEVIDLAGRNKRSVALFKVICHKCKEDKELFPLGYFISNKSNLVINKQKPCGCSKQTKWEDWQHLILAQRVAEGRFIIHGFAEEFKDSKTKLNLECLKDGHKWTASINNIRQGKGCPECGKLSSSKLQRTQPKDALAKCKEICKIEGYEPLGFPDGYKNCGSIFEYKCPKHGNQIVNYSNFIHSMSECKECALESSGQKRRGDISLKIEKCLSVCKYKGYKFIKIDQEYRKKTRITYECEKHGLKSTDYYNFLNGNGCKDCWKETQKELGNLYGYYPSRKEEVDYLYILDFNGKYVKVGRSFDIPERIRSLKRDSKIKQVHKLRIFTATHQEIYDLEQELHSELRERNFQHYVDWSTECFTSDSLPFLNMLLDKCGLEEVELGYVSMCCQI